MVLCERERARARARRKRERGFINNEEVTERSLLTINKWGGGRGGFIQSKSSERERAYGERVRERERERLCNGEGGREGEREGER